jgi:hypothetical protein
VRPLLTSADGQGDVVHAGGAAAETACLQGDRARAPDRAGRFRGQLAPDHEADEGRAVQVARGAGLHDLPVTEDGHAVRDLEDLVQAVRDVDDRQALGAQVAQQRQERTDLRDRQRSRGLVQDQDARLRAQRARDLAELLLRHAERARGTVGVEGQAQAGQQLARAPSPRRPVDAPEQARRLVSQRHVLGDREVREQRRLLVDDRDAQRARLLGRQVGQLLAVERQRAGVGRVRAAQDADERRLAGAVLAHQGQHLGALHVERHVLQGAHAAERLAEPAHRQHGHGGVCRMGGRRARSRVRL